MSTIDKIRYNGTEYDIGGSLAKEEIYNADGLILEKMRKCNAFIY